MELGNAVFGHSRGEYHINDRSAWQDVFWPLQERMTGEWECIKEFENDTFSIRPYVYDADCTCGYDDIEAAWFDANPHEPNCYQIALARSENAIGKITGDTTWNTQGIEPTDEDIAFVRTVRPAMEWSKSGANRHVSEWRDKARMMLCQCFNLPYPQGCMVHCTCSRDEKWAEFCKDHGHAPTCELIRPNFVHKPTGYSVMWYKYPFRDSYANQDITLEVFREIVKQCIDSLGVEVGGERN